MPRAVCWRLSPLERMKPPKPNTKEQGTRTKKLLWAGGGAVVVLGLVAILWARRFHDYTPIEAALDLKAGFAARHAPVPAKQFLELRYGPQTNPTNRTAAFIDLFNVGHIEGLYLIAGNRTDSGTRKGVEDIAQILRDHRQSMTPEEKQALADYFGSPLGKAQIQQATAGYQSKDARFRAMAAPIIQELMTTLALVQKP